MMSVDQPAAAAIQEPAAQPDEAIFRVGQQVLAVNKTQLYVAKINRTRKAADGTSEFFIHYLGWKSRHDEWVRDNRLVEDNDAGRRLQKSMIANGGVVIDDDFAGVAGAKDGDESEEEELPGIKLAVPNTLQKQLLDENELISNAGKLQPLPRTPSVREILAQFIESKGALDTVESKLYGEMRDGLIYYMDMSLPMVLLYPNEVEGHDRLVASHPGKAASDLYGGEHLLRLIVTLPALLNKAEMTQRNLAALQPRLQELLRFMEKGFVTYFLSESQYIVGREGGDDGGADAAGGGKAESQYIIGREGGDDGGADVAGGGEGVDGEGAGGAGGGQ